MKFELGNTSITLGANALLDEFQISPLTLLDRHVSGDWGDLDSEDKARNERALLDGDRLFSSYKVSEHAKVYVITEWDRSQTTILLPSEY
jgi:hypothetical protein